MDYRDRLRWLRGSYGMTQTAFAKMLGVSVKRWNHYERGYSVPHKAMRLLCEKTGAMPDWIYFGWEGNMPRALLWKIRTVQVRDACHR